MDKIAPKLQDAGMCSWGIEPIYLEHYPNEELDDNYKLCPQLGDTSPAWDTLSSWSYAIVQTLRLTEVTKLADKTGTFFEHTFIFADYSNYEPLRNYRTKIQQIAFDAKESGFISEEFTEEIFAEQMSLAGSATKTPASRLGHPFYIELMNKLMSHIGFNALSRVYEWVYREKKDRLGLRMNCGNYLLDDYHKARIDQKIDQYGNHFPTAERAQEALDWIVQHEDFFYENTDFLPVVVAHVNLRAGIENGLIPRMFNPDINDMQDSVFELASNEVGKPKASIEQVTSIKPSVVSLFSRERFLGDDQFMEFETQTDCYNCFEINAFLEASAELPRKIVIKSGEGELPTTFSHLLEVDAFYQGVRRGMHDHAVKRWDKRMHKLRNFVDALEYWNEHIHGIGIDWEKFHDPEPPYKNLEEGINALVVIIDMFKTVGEWIEEEAFEDLVTSFKQEAKAEELSDEDIIVRELKSHDPKKLGCNLRQVFFFYKLVRDKNKPCPKGGRISNAEDVKRGWATKTGSVISRPIVNVVPAEPSKFIRNVIYQDHAGDKSDPIEAHPIYQDFLEQLPDHSRKQSDVGDHNVYNATKNQQGESFTKIAKWMLENLPTKTKEMVEIYKADSGTES